MPKDEQPRFRRSKIASAAGVALGLGLTVAASVTALGFTLARTNPALAFEVAPWHGAALGAYTEYRVQTNRSKEEVPQIQRLALTTLRRSPLDFEAGRTLGAIAIGQQRFDYATAIMNLVASATLRERISHAWMLDQAYKARDFKEVIRQSDVVLRQQASMQKAAFPMLNELVKQGDIVGDLARFLASNPPWRSAFLNDMGENGTSPANEYRLFELLKQSKSPPTAEELQTWFLVNNAKMTADALTKRYAAVAPKSPTDVSSIVINGKFAGSEIPPPFNWVFSPQENGYAEIDRSPTGDGKALYVEFSGREPMTMANQIVNLKPGSYRLRFRTYPLTNFDSKQTAVTVECRQIDKTVIPVVRIPLAGELDQWRTKEQSFTVPEKCDTPLLSVKAQPATVSRVERAYIDDISIQPN